MERRYPPMVSHEKNTLRFWETSVENGPASAKVGRPIFNQVVYVTVESPGSHDTQDYEVETVYPEAHPHPAHGGSKINPLMQRRFPDEIKRFREMQGGKTRALDGTPIEEWPVVNFRQAANLASHNILTVEMLAEVPDSSLQSIGMGGRELRQKAKDWIKTATDKAAVMQQVETERKLREEMDRMRAQMDELATALDALPAEAQLEVKTRLSKRRQAA